MPAKKSFTEKCSLQFLWIIIALIIYHKFISPHTTHSLREIPFLQINLESAYIQGPLNNWKIYLYIFLSLIHNKTAITHTKFLNCVFKNLFPLLMKKSCNFREKSAILQSNLGLHEIWKKWNKLKHLQALPFFCR